MIFKNYLTVTLKEVKVYREFRMMIKISILLPHKLINSNKIKIQVMNIKWRANQLIFLQIESLNKKLIDLQKTPYHCLRYSAPRVYNLQMFSTPNNPKTMVK